MASSKHEIALALEAVILNYGFILCSQCPIWSTRQEVESSKNKIILLSNFVHLPVYDLMAVICLPPSWCRTGNHFFSFLLDANPEEEHQSLGRGLCFSLSTAQPMRRQLIATETLRKIMGSSFSSECESSRTVCISALSFPQHVPTGTQLGRSTFAQIRRGITDCQ